MHADAQGGAVAVDTQQIISDQPRFLIARMSAIGDTILTLPVACALRDHYPDAYIAWAVERGAATAVLGHDAIDDVVVLPRGWYVSPTGIASARSRLRALEVDVAIDCQSVSKTAMACWLSGAKTRLGCRGKYGAELSPWLNNLLIEPEQPHLTDRSLELLAPLGIESPRIDWRYPLEDQSLDRMAELVQQEGLERGYAVINPGATWDSKLWECDRFADVARRLGVEQGLTSLVVWGNPRERDWAEAIVVGSGGQARMAPRTSLAELAALLMGARLVISPDTGPLHMAVAVGAPCIGLYGATRLEDCGPYGATNIGLQNAYEEGSRKHRRRADNSAMREIFADDVYDACLALLGRSARRAA
ncbi:Lipopolysaccharide heptosyltransferase 1 [Pirellulimonas nuda]|uniref:Lipopolysaccharide heptosyltransferase 1 n=1 Tax=Pirellulimonas nuda TaxID=2528009 RepID=A0A518D8M3_9BACT|nr:glycosyltransferase family 9 protein [Pirellulimonas nuda]QDU87790.1 Lipopolysaccharide heptosyltransferase 1 [Pirellulimonas nuda]